MQAALKKHTERRIRASILVTSFMVYSRAHRSSYDRSVQPRRRSHGLLPETGSPPAASSSLSYGPYCCLRVSVTVLIYLSWLIAPLVDSCPLARRGRARSAEANFGFHVKC